MRVEYWRSEGRRGQDLALLFRRRRGKEDYAREIVILRVRGDDTAVQMWDKSTAVHWHRAGNPCRCCCSLDVLCKQKLPPSENCLWVFLFVLFWFFFISLITINFIWDSLLIWKKKISNIQLSLLRFFHEMHHLQPNYQNRRIQSWLNTYWVKPLV